MSWICESVPVSGKISLGVVDQSALRKGSSASEALADSVRLAREVEQFWALPG